MCVYVCVCMRYLMLLLITYFSFLYFVRDLMFSIMELFLLLFLIHFGFKLLKVKKRKDVRGKKLIAFFLLMIR